jgi:hypothetical protein
MKAFQNFNKVIAVMAAVFVILVCLKSFAHQRPDQDEPPKNLKVLPKDMSGDEVKKIMKVFTKSLGVKCDHCHVGTPQPDKPFPKFDFASDQKPEKEIARRMMLMVNDINMNHISKMDDGDLEHVTCVTCHMGNLKPVVTVDSLMKK